LFRYGFEEGKYFDVYIYENPEKEIAGEWEK